MSRRLDFTQLLLFIDDSLRPYTGKIDVSITKETEKQLLISLSQVLRQVKVWTQELDCESDDDDMLDKVSGSSECPAGTPSQPPHCLSKIIGDLVLFLAIDSQYVQHVAGNVLLAVSEFVMEYESYWLEFMRTLCFCLELSILNSLSSSLGRPVTANNLDCDSLVLDLLPNLSSANWGLVGGIFRILRNILKHLKHAHDDQLFEVYLDSLSCCLPILPWDLLQEVRDCEVGRSKTWFEFCGYLVQFFCSLVYQCSSMEDAAVCVDKHPAICEISIIIPKVLIWCLGNQGDCNNMGLSHYFRHKILVLMIRLSSHLKLDCSIFIAWLHLIHKYFQDLLLEPITKLKSGQDDCLEGSPFLLFLSNGEKKRTSRRHLQRLTIFLFLRCSFSLVSLRERSKDQCLCVNTSSCMAAEGSGAPKCCRKKGLAELYEWLQVHVPTDILENNKLYSARCNSFTKSFLQLYMHEDDLLFKVLLQLSALPFKSKQKVREERTSKEVDDDMLFLVSETFHPIYLFHLFLAELLYDHQVLLDYLISKDTGASSAEYLLRCLRTVCDSWSFFSEFSFTEVIKESPQKRRKGVDGLSHQQELLSTDIEGDWTPLSLEAECQRKNICGSKHHRTSGQPFEAAMECLLSLKISMENLHKKNLFPYNPEVLLRRFSFKLSAEVLMSNLEQIIFYNLFAVLEKMSGILPEAVAHHNSNWAEKEKIYHARILCFSRITHMDAICQ